MDDFDADVIIVGAGPTGLMLAGELRLGGVRALVLERLAEPVRQSRALGFSARALEEFDQRGLVPRFGEVQTIPIGHFGGLVIDFRVVNGGSYGVRGIPQSRTEAILAAWATELGAEVRRRHEVTGLSADDDGVEVEVATPEGPRRLRAAYVVGCDGAHSKVRALAGIEFPGTEPTMEMWMADVAGAGLRHRFVGERTPGGMVMVLPAGPGVDRVGVYERAAGLRGADEAPTFAEVAGAFQRLTGEDIHDASPLWVSWFTDASRQASRYRQGRVLVAGDAAHVHLPQGAQGMSAGIGDAMNLGWKLAAEIRGYAPPGLLDTYHSERHPVGARILANSLAQRILYLGGEEMQPVRDMFAELLEHESVQRHLAGMVSGLDIRYDVGSTDHPVLGRRLPNREMVGASGEGKAYEWLHRARPVVFDRVGDPATAAALEPWRDRVDLVSAAPRGGRKRIDAMLVRPDGYVAWVGADGSGAEGLPEALAKWFGPPAPAERPAVPVTGSAPVA
ncbi:FAD-dependent monooxygenase [Actinomadura luteofluorescens]|uniref:FAD-dependent monooxygenase n=1 Tax=Actinomadura luteofluorescens TaxID=46163 RepID=UPI00348599CA